jgi:hypothetical protein
MYGRGPRVGEEVRDLQQEALNEAIVRENPVEHKTTLYSTVGGADKQYTIWMTGSGSKWRVEFQFGPRGGWLQGGTKTPVPVSRSMAESILDKMLGEKLKKGYEYGHDAPPASQTPGRSIRGIRNPARKICQACKDNWHDECDGGGCPCDCGWGTTE